jgi:mRNA-degrading endonuclease RelE of RelBE toxin-antitoxin system
MKLVFTKKFIRDYRKLPQRIQRTAGKQLGYLLSDETHPSLNVKKMQDPREIWEARVTKSYRLTFQKTEAGYLLRRIGKHDTLANP